MDEPRVLICGSRRWPWPDTVEAVLDRLHARYTKRLVVIESAATGADRAAHRWCDHQRLPAWRHRCYPTAWNAERQRRPRTWTGPERHQRILTDEEPRLVIVFHENLNPALGDTADTCLRALHLGIPVWHTPNADPDQGQWLTRGYFPSHHADPHPTRLDPTCANHGTAPGATAPQRHEDLPRERRDSEERDAGPIRREEHHPLRCVQLPSLQDHMAAKRTEEGNR